MAASDADFDDFKLFSVKEKRPQGRGKITVARFKADYDKNHYIPPSHACYLGMKTRRNDNNNTTTVSLYFTGGYNLGDPNIAVESASNMKIINIEIDPLAVKISSVKDVPCMNKNWTYASGYQLKKSFYIFGGYDPQQRTCSGKFFRLQEVEKASGEPKFKKSLISSQDHTNPTPRFGHTLDHMIGSDISLLIGGVYLPNRHRPQCMATNVFKIVSIEDVLYTFNHTNKTWVDISGILREFIFEDIK